MLLVKKAKPAPLVNSSLPSPHVCAGALYAGLCVGSWSNGCNPWSSRAHTPALMYMFLTFAPAATFIRLLACWLSAAQLQLLTTSRHWVCCSHAALCMPCKSLLCLLYLDHCLYAQSAYLQTHRPRSSTARAYSGSPGGGSRSSAGRPYSAAGSEPSSTSLPKLLSSSRAVGGDKPSGGGSGLVLGPSMTRRAGWDACCCCGCWPGPCAALPVAAAAAAAVVPAGCVAAGLMEPEGAAKMPPSKGGLEEPAVNMASKRARHQCKSNPCMREAEDWWACL